jgi:hypothetical protein
MEHAHGYMRTYLPLFDNFQIDIDRATKQVNELQAEVRSAERATGADKDTKIKALNQKFAKNQAADLMKLQRRTQALDKVLKYHYESTISDMELTIAKEHYRAKKLREMQPAMEFFEDEEVKKWLV